jgi:hypothetical protein
MHWGSLMSMVVMSQPALECLLPRPGLNFLHLQQGEKEPAQRGETGADQDERVETDEVVESSPDVLGKLYP